MVSHTARWRAHGNRIPTPARVSDRRDQHMVRRPPQRIVIALWLRIIGSPAHLSGADHRSADGRAHERKQRCMQRPLRRRITVVLGRVGGWSIGEHRSAYSAADGDVRGQPDRQPPDRLKHVAAQHTPTRISAAGKPRAKANSTRLPPARCRWHLQTGLRRHIRIASWPRQGLRAPLEFDRVRLGGRRGGTRAQRVAQRRQHRGVSARQRSHERLEHESA